MRPGRAIWKAMPRVQLDADTADRMLAGRLEPADLPPGYERVGELLQSLTLFPVPGAIEAPALKPPARRHLVFVSLPARLRLSTAALLTACCLTGATAAYAAGLPQTASDTASSILSKLGVNTGSGSHDGKGHSVSAIARDPALTGAAKGAAVSAAASGGKADSGRSYTSGDAATGKGSTISQLATTTTATGVAKGALISSAASAGKSQAGTHGSSTGLTASAAGRAQATSSKDGHSSGGSGSTAR
jgi:hypothetical protein